MSSGKELVPVQRRTYGTWRVGRPAQLLGLGPAGALAAMGVAVIAVLTSMYSPAWALVIAVAGALCLAPLAIRIGPRTVASILAARIAWTTGKRARKHLWRTGIADEVGTHRLPGLLARSQLWETESGLGGRIGVVIVPRTRHYTAVLHCHSEGLDLVDQSVIDRRVDHYAAWLAQLTREQDLVQAQVIIETAPDPGTRLAAEIDTTTADDAPDLARQVLDEVKAAAPAAAATVDIYVALTWKATGPVDHTDMCLQVMGRLPALARGLEGTGAVAIRTLDAAGIARVMACAYNPGEADQIARADAEALDWAQIGPGAAVEGSTWYLHGSGLSATWGMVEAPRGVVTEGVFARMAMPDPGLRRKRVALVYHPYTPAEARRQVEKDRRDAGFNLNREASKGKPSMRTKVEVEAAEQAAAEEAAGAGLVRFTVLATVTVDADGPGPDKKPDPKAAATLAEALKRLETAAGDARIDMRPMREAQSAAFAAATPAGIVLPDHASAFGKP